MLESKGVANSEDEITHLDFGGVPQSDLHQGAVGFDFQDRDVGRLVAADDLGLQVAAIL